MFLPGQLPQGSHSAATSHQTEAYFVCEASQRHKQDTYHMFCSLRGSDWAVAKY